MNAQTPQKFTLEEIAERKKKLLNEIHAQKKAGLGREDAVISLIENTDAALRPGIPAAGRRFFAAAQKQKTDVPEQFF